MFRFVEYVIPTFPEVLADVRLWGLEEETVITIAHYLNTVQNADKIIVMEYLVSTIYGDLPHPGTVPARA